MLMWQLRRATARFHRQNENIFKNDEHDAVTSVFQNAFSFFPWKMKRSTRARVANKYNHKVNYTHIHCVYVCWWGVSDPNNVFVIFFQHEINHAPLVFHGTDFWSTVPLHRACADAAGLPTVIDTRYHSDPNNDYYYRGGPENERLNQWMKSV